MGALSIRQCVDGSWCVLRGGYILRIAASKLNAEQFAATLTHSARRNKRRKRYTSLT